MPTGRASPRAHVYIDGFNLYNGAIKGTPYRWLDLQRLADDLLRGYTVECVKYFTAIVDDRPGDPGQSQRQQVFLGALRTLDRVEIHYGLFRTNKVKRPLVKRGRNRALNSPMQTERSRVRQNGRPDP